MERVLEVARLHPELSATLLPVKIKVFPQGAFVFVTL